MWIKDQAPPTPEHFDEHYRTLAADDAGVLERVRQTLDLVGETRGKHILDLGGGALMCRYIKDHTVYIQVDYSQEACNRARAHCTVHNMDVMKYLQMPTQPFDVTIACGIIEYLPPSSLWRLFNLVPSPVLVFGVSTAEAYLQYPARITIPSRTNVLDAATEFGWKMVRELPMPSHVWARFER